MNKDLDKEIEELHNRLLRIETFADIIKEDIEYLHCVVGELERFKHESS